MPLYLQQFKEHYLEDFASSRFNRDLDKFIQRLNVQGFDAALMVRLFYADLYMMCSHYDYPHDVTISAWFKRTLKYFGIDLDKGIKSDDALASPQSSDKE